MCSSELLDLSWLNGAVLYLGPPGPGGEGRWLEGELHGLLDLYLEGLAWSVWSGWGPREDGRSRSDGPSYRLAHTHRHAGGGEADGLGLYAGNYSFTNKYRQETLTEGFYLYNGSDFTATVPDLVSPPRSDEPI